jgi:uncharacterized protein YfiM (DUF2279 family)
LIDSIRRGILFETTVTILNQLKLNIMKAAIIILFVVVSNIANSQIRKDKTLHFGAGILVGGITALVSERIGISDNKFQTLFLSTSVSTAVAIGKEAYDQLVKKTFADGRDILWTAIGGFVGGLTVTYTIKPRNKHKNPVFEI